MVENPAASGRATVSTPELPSTPPGRVVDDDGDYEYYWSAGGLDFRVPRWLAEILDVPLIVRWELFLVGLCTGLVIAAVTVLIAFLSAT
ncbi:MAG: hypothetical protein ACLGI5_17565 [Thermoleophilia bacterium]